MAARLRANRHAQSPLGLRDKSFGRTAERGILAGMRARDMHDNAELWNSTQIPT